MNKRLTVIAVVAIALMLAGIAWAVTRLYREDKPAQPAVSTEYPLLRAVPADAAAVFCFDGSSRARKVLSDSTGVLRAFLASDSPALMDYLSKAGESRMLVSMHNSGSLVPLVASEVKSADSTLLAPYLALAEKTEALDVRVYLNEKTEVIVQIKGFCLDEATADVIMEKARPNVDELRNDKDMANFVSDVTLAKEGAKNVVFSCKPNMEVISAFATIFAN